MLRTLHGKLSAVLFGLLCLVGLLYVPLTLFATDRYLEEVHQKLNRTLARNIAEHLVEKRILREDMGGRARAIAEIKRVMFLNPTIEIYLLDLQGRVLAYSGAAGKVQQQRVSLTPVRRFLASPEPPPTLGDDPRNPGVRKVFSAATVMVAGKVQGYLYVILGGEEYDSVAERLQQSYILRLSLGIALGGLVLTLLAGLVFFYQLTRRLRELAVAVEGQFRRRVATATTPPYDEIDQLGIVYNQMVDRNEQLISDLRRVDTLRRELVSNVSHDLRTPLAALQGYLETLLIKQNELAPEEQRNYLLTAIKQGERLGKLVADLFEMAKLEAREVQLQIETFSLSELVQDVVQQFQLAAEQKKVTLKTHFADGLPVAGDIARIEQVLVNLLENALRYTDTGGVITASVFISGPNVAVRIEDTGTGIAPEDLPYLFDRYYRVQKRPPQGEGAGLGLAIARRILELHNGSIRVESAPGTGSAFTFELPVSTQR